MPPANIQKLTPSLRIEEAENEVQKLSNQKMHLIFDIFDRNIFAVQMMTQNSAEFLLLRTIHPLMSKL
jgi:hypothetical protein